MIKYWRFAISLIMLLGCAFLSEKVLSFPLVAQILNNITLLEKNPSGWIATSLTLASILFMVQSFAIPFAKQFVYDSEEYTATLIINDSNNNTCRYKQLSNLSDFLFFSILNSILSGACIILGCFYMGFVLMAVWYAILAMLGFLISLWAARSTFNYMFKSRGHNAKDGQN